MGFISEGQRLLHLVLEEITARALARKCKTRAPRCRLSEPTLSRYRTGSRTPQALRERQVLQLEAGIPVEAWDEAANDTARASA